MITTINEFRKYLNEADEITTNISSVDILDKNQSKEKLDAYKLLISHYNMNKGKFKALFLKDPKIQEKEALKIYQIEINPLDKKKYNNKYLFMQWDIEKLQNKILEITKNIENLTAQQSTLQEEQKQENIDNIKKLQDELKVINITIIDKKNELKQEISEDLKEIQKLNSIK